MSDPSTEDVARRLLVSAATQAPTTVAPADLFALQNGDGGFPGTVGYQSDPFDTALALFALSAQHGATSPAIQNALGFLRSSANTDTAWGWNGQSEVFVTSYMLLAAQRWGAGDIASTAQTWLLAQRNSSQQFPTELDNIVALLALPSVTADATILTPLHQAVVAAQAIDGSWNEDPYLTALAVEALQAATSSPVQTSIRGRVTDAQTGIALSGAGVALSGSQSYTQQTDVNGAFAFGNVVAGSYTLQVTSTGYNTLSATVIVGVGQSLDLGVLALVPNSSGAPTTGTVEGTVTDASTHSPIANASIAVNGIAATSGSDGTYEVPNVPAGTVAIAVSANGFQSVTASAVLSAGGIVSFSPQLTPGSAAGTGTAIIQGTVTDASTHAPVSGATLTVSGADSATAQTDGNGNYRISGLAPGTVQIAATAAGYDSVSATTLLVRNTTTTFSPSLYATGTSPPNANTSSVSGTVIDSTSGSALANVNVSGTSPDNSTVSTTTDASGHFQLTGLTHEQVALQFALTGYVAAQFSVLTLPSQDLAIGSVRLRPVGVAQLLPDLIVARVDSKTDVVNDPQSLALSGTVHVTVGNHGTGQAAGGFQVLAFYDVNGNGVYDAGTDTVIGTGTSAAAIAPQGTRVVDVPVSGSLPFRDAPIAVWVDSTDRVVELNKSNNVGSSTSACRLTPPPTTLTPALKWAWNGSPADPTHNNVYGPIVVGHLTDDNGDGKYDQNDIPTLVFAAGDRSDNGGTTVLVAVSGLDGHELWRRSDLNVTSRGSATIADIDGDGKPEILISNADRTQLIALRNDGSLLWTTPTGPQYYYGSFEWVSDGITVADLNQDGHPKIIQGTHVFDNQGNLLWVGQGDGGGPSDGDWVGYGYVPIAADVIPDSPGMEVIAGRTMYASDGHILWNRTDIPCDGFNAVADFGYPNPPQVVLVSCGKLYLLDRSGNTIWQTALAGGGRGGAPTIADFDGEGRPQIGVAASLNYAVYGPDGSIRWTASTRDTSSNITASSAFDFLVNGRIEVLYGDEHQLYIFDGATGSTLWSTENPSETTFEYPVIADVDNDGHADFIVGANNSFNYPTLTERGVRVFSAATGGWAPTRTIWNEHAYHVTNINDDGSVPQFEEPSWTNGNTYRLNQFLNHAALDGPDLSIGLLKVIDNGTGQALTIAARIGNGGQIATAPTSVAFYNGDPTQGGTSIGSVAIDAIAPATYVDIQLTGVTAPPSATAIYAVVDPTDLVPECDKTNNVDHIAYGASNVVAQLTVGTDAASYGANQSVQVTASATNNGSFPVALTLDVRIEDAGGGLVSDLGSVSLGSVASGASAGATPNWNTGASLAGAYKVHGLLYDTNGDLVAEAFATFTLSAQTSAASLAVATTQQTYATTQAPTFTYTVVNSTGTAIWSDAHVHLQAVDASANVVFDHDFDLGEVVPGGVREGDSQGISVPLPAGSYTLNGTLRDGQGSTPFATASATFTVTTQTATLLKASVTASSTEVLYEQSVTCTASIGDRGPDAITAQPVRLGVRNLVNGTLAGEADSSISLAASGSWNNNIVVPASSLGIGSQACVVEAQIGGNWTVIASAPFGVFYATDLQTQLSTRSMDLGAGQIQYLHVLVTNSGPDTSVGAGLTLTLPAQIAWLGIQSPSLGCTSAAGGIQCPLPNLVPGQSVDVCLATRASASAVTSVQTSAVTAIDRSAYRDPNSGNDTALLTTQIVPDLVFAYGFEFDGCGSLANDIIFIDGFE